MAQWSDTSNTNRIEHSSWDVNLADFDPNYDPTYDLEAKEEEDRGSRIGRDGFEGVMILIGNKHRLIRNPGDDNEHDWTFFVRTSRPDLIKEVHIHLVRSRVLFQSRQGSAFNITMPRSPRTERLVSPRGVRQDLGKDQTGA